MSSVNAESPGLISPTYKPSLELYEVVWKRNKTEDVNPVRGLTAHTPANPDDVSDRIGSQTRETKYATMEKFMINSEPSLVISRGRGADQVLVSFIIRATDAESP